MINEYTKNDKFVLIALYISCNGSTNCHASKEAIKAKLPKEMRLNNKRMKEFSKILKRLRTKQLIQKHPTKGNVTW